MTLKIKHLSSTCYTPGHNVVIDDAVDVEMLPCRGLEYSGHGCDEVDTGSSSGVSLYCVLDAFAHFPLPP